MSNGNRDFVLSLLSEDERASVEALSEHHATIVDIIVRDAAAESAAAPEDAPDCYHIGPFYDAASEIRELVHWLYVGHLFEEGT